MIFSKTPLAGAYVIEPQRLTDERGFFARGFCRREFEEHGLCPDISQCNISYNSSAGTLRGLHYQADPFAEDKLVRCTAGAVFDVMVDLRPGSATRFKWFGAELTARNHKMLLVPRGFAHGFLTLADHSEVFYQVSQAYTPSHERGLRWDDPAFSIVWPHRVEVISPKDAAHPYIRPNMDLGVSP